MKFRFSLGAAFALLSTLILASPVGAQAPKNISMTVGVCDPAYGLRCIKPDTNGAVPVTGSLTPSGTQDTNLKQVNGATVNVGAGAAGTGTQRVTTSTDSTIGTVTTVTAVTAITNALPAGTAILGKVGIDQTTPGTTNGVQVNAALPAGANIIGKAGIDQTTPGTTNGVVVNSSALPTGASTATNQTAPQTPVAPASATATVAVGAGGQYAAHQTTGTAGQQAIVHFDLGGGLRVSGCETNSTSQGSCDPVQIGALDAGGGQMRNLSASQSNSDLTQSSTVSRLNTDSLVFLAGTGTGMPRAKDTVAASASNAGTGVIAVEEAGRPFVNITTATTTTVKSGAGFLHGITVNTSVAAATITLYDNTAGSGTKIGTITLGATAVPQQLSYDVAFSTGLTIVTSGATDLTVSYR